MLIIAYESADNFSQFAQLFVVQIILDIIVFYVDIYFYVRDVHVSLVIFSHDFHLHVRFCVYIIWGKI